MNTDTAILNALPAHTVVTFVGYENLTYTYTRRDDGRWTGRYTSEQGSLCANGVTDTRRVARALTTAREVRFA